MKTYLCIFVFKLELPKSTHTHTHLVDVKVDLRCRLKLSVQSRDATGPHQVLHLVFEDQQLDPELLLRHVQESGQFGHWHSGVELQETERNTRVSGGVFITTNMLQLQVGLGNRILDKFKLMLGRFEKKKLKTKISL